MKIPYKLVKVDNYSLVATAQPIPTNSQPFMIANNGAQPLYINPSVTASAANGFLIPANTVLQKIFTASPSLSAISNSTGTTLSILTLEI